AITGRAVCGPGGLQSSGAPGAGGGSSGRAVAVEAPGGPEGVVAGVEQPPAEACAVRRHGGRVHGGARLSQNPHAPRAGNVDLGTAIAVVVGTSRLITRRLGDQFAQVRTVADALAGRPAWSVLLRRATRTDQH